MHTQAGPERLCSKDHQYKAALRQRLHISTFLIIEGGGLGHLNHLHRLSGVVV